MDESTRSSVNEVDPKLIPSLYVSSCRYVYENNHPSTNKSVRSSNTSIDSKLLQGGGNRCLDCTGSKGGGSIPVTTQGWGWGYTIKALKTMGALRPTFQ